MRSRLRAWIPAVTAPAQHRDLPAAVGQDPDPGLVRRANRCRRAGRVVMNSSLVPAGYRVTARRAETHDTVSLTLEPAAEPIAPFRPGQFTMLYAFGVGEIPVSVSGPAGQPALIQTIRAVGAVSRALCAAGTGQLVGVRGPFGTSWDEGDAAGRDLMLVAGGI